MKYKMTLPIPFMQYARTYFYNKYRYQINNLILEFNNSCLKARLNKTKVKMPLGNTIDLVCDQDNEELEIDLELCPKLENTKINVALDDFDYSTFDPPRDQNNDEYKTNSGWELFQRRLHEWESREILENFDPEVDCKPLSYDAKYAKLEPQIRESIFPTSPNHWDIGSLMTCEKVEVGQEVPSDAVCTWMGDGARYCLRKRSVPKIDRSVNGDRKYGIVRSAFYNSVWTLSPNVFCKVVTWVEGSTTDAETLRFINKNIPSIPTEEVIYDWADQEWSRAFMLSRRVPGTRFDEAWPNFTEEQKLHIATQVAKHAKSLSEFTSDYVESVIGRGLNGEFRLQCREDLPHWKPRFEPRASREEFRAWVIRTGDRHGVPDFGGPFVLQHWDLNPTNIFITTPLDTNKAVKVTAIIDWENVGYLPKWYVTKFPRTLVHFAIEDQPDGWHWMWMLSNALFDEGFPLEIDYLTRVTNERKLCVYNLPK
jgi:hypothetical protein